MPMGNIWFFSKASNLPKVKDHMRNRRLMVHLGIASPGKDTYLDIRGTEAVEKKIAKSIERKMESNSIKSLVS
jgi:general stress protein 26